MIIILYVACLVILHTGQDLHFLSYVPEVEEIL